MVSQSSTTSMATVIALVRTVVDGIFVVDVKLRKAVINGISIDWHFSILAMTIHDQIDEDMIIGGDSVLNVDADVVTVDMLSTKVHL
ncbi:hypothetical protein NDU88_001514 [Pleurodeles waltl]|uniref:Uncharacterized protein n=1 Tax=Pleurodeles waltl TaxID=8319 RepID=A0AAV7TJA4_PLEWA|nr:hypothetical protein NDU88_001514 [Pleurodeles waltl]